MLISASWLGIPVSTTHTITGCVIGAGAARRASAVRWQVAGNVMTAWVITIPASASMAAHDADRPAGPAVAGVPPIRIGGVDQWADIDV